jgi:hypothetical protein
MTEVRKITQGEIDPYIKSFISFEELCFKHEKEIKSLMNQVENLQLKIRLMQIESESQIYFENTNWFLRGKYPYLIQEKEKIEKRLEELEELEALIAQKEE